MNYSIDYKAFSSIFAVPAEVVEKYIRVCSGTALKVLLCILASPKEPITVSRLSGQLGFPPDDIEESLEYWGKTGILTAANPILRGKQPEYQQEMLAPSQPKQKLVKVTTKKNMSIQEINQLAQTDPNISVLVNECQSIMGRVLSPSELEVLCSLYTYAGLSPEYILLVVMYCVSREKSSIRYIEKVVYSLLEKEIDTYEKAEQFFADSTSRETNEGAVKAAFGIYERRLSTQEKKFVDTWFNTFGFDISLVKLAYERTIDNIGKLSFPYINSILTSWHQKGITTAKEASLEAFSSKPAKPGKDGAFQNSSIDMDELQYHITHGKSPLK